MPPAYVKPYVKRQKNDAADAEAICEAVAPAELRSRVIDHHYIAELLERNPLDETSSGGGTLTQKLPVLALSYPY
jgi:hypothetical protein